jgi:o-succinylbenzoate synthase
MLNAIYTKYLLQFKQPAGTSRGILNTKEIWFIKIWDENNPLVFGLGECAVFRGLSCDDKPDYEVVLNECCNKINDSDFLSEKLIHWPSIRFGIETAILDLKNNGIRILFPSEFVSGTNGIPINGLIWMGSMEFIQQQVKEKLNAGYHCLKFKVGSNKLDEELQLLKILRNEFNPDDLEIRLDANGAFPLDNVQNILEKLSKFTIHSIEQPIKPGNIEFLEQLCKSTPIPIALDEELIGINQLKDKKELITKIRPQYIIVKPALTGGFSGAAEWISIATELNTGWWITSALESNIGLNAIAQWTYTLGVKVVQGLGTGSLFTNNISSPLTINNQQLFININIHWDISTIQFNDK